MSILCFAMYARCLQSALQPPNNNQDVVSLLLGWITDKPDVINKNGDPIHLLPSLVSDLFNCKVNVPKSIKDVCTTETILQEATKHFEDHVMPCLNPSLCDEMFVSLIQMIDSDSEIPANKKKHFLALLENDKKAAFLGELLIYVINIKNLKDKKPEKSSLPDVSNRTSISDNIPTENQFDDDENERIEQEATAFCIKYDDQKELIPLCQIAQITNPIRKHSRLMYNEFSSCRRSVQRKILEFQDICAIDIPDKEQWRNYLRMFEQDYEKYELGDKRFLYSFGQYFPRLLEYGDKTIEVFLTNVFSPKVVNSSLRALSNYKHDVRGLIFEYITYRKYDEYKDVLEPPMDYLWRELCFGNCSEFMLATLLALFIIGTCHAIPVIDNSKAQGFSGPNVHDLETAEDLYYLTILTLYETYMR